MTERAEIIRKWEVHSDIGNKESTTDHHSSKWQVRFDLGNISFVCPLRRSHPHWMRRWTFNGPQKHSPAGRSARSGPGRLGPRLYRWYTHWSSPRIDFAAIGRSTVHHSAFQTWCIELHCQSSQWSLGDCSLEYILSHLHVARKHCLWIMEIQYAYPVKTL